MDDECPWYTLPIIMCFVCIDHFSSCPSYCPKEGKDDGSGSKRVPLVDPDPPVDYGSSDDGTPGVPSMDGAPGVPSMDGTPGVQSME